MPKKYPEFVLLENEAVLKCPYCGGSSMTQLVDPSVSYEPAAISSKEFVCNICTKHSYLTLIWCYTDKVYTHTKMCWKLS